LPIDKRFCRTQTRRDNRSRSRSFAEAADALRATLHTAIENENDDEDENDYINVAPASARGLRSPFVRQTWAVIG
jgi:hypothetical protein